MDRTRSLPRFFLFGSFTAALAACQPATNSGSAPAIPDNAAYAPVVFEGEGYKILEPGESQAAAINVTMHKLSKTVCDPFGGGGGGTSLRQGIQADLYWLDQQAPRYEKAEEFIQYGVKSEKSLFFKNLYTPTRLFSAGFATQDSEVVKDDQGQVLVEWFALKFNASLRLPADGAATAYEFALLSDDGSVLSVKENNQWRRVLENDGLQMTKMGCSNKTVTISRDNPVPFELLYYQGPRYNIANVLLWRPANPKTLGKDPQCGKNDNDMYFDYNNGSKPKKPYTDLLARGWAPVPAEAFVIPEETSYNPCYQGEAPVISNLRVLEIMPTGAILAWSTDKLSSTQLRFRNLSTGEVLLTEPDNRMRTMHSVWLSSLTPSTSYEVEVVAITEDNGRAVSDKLRFTTP